MNILVANLGSTSFKYRLFVIDGAQARLVTKGGSERVTDYGAAIEQALRELAAGGHVKSAEDLDGVGFKTVFAGDLTGCVIADEAVEQALRATADLAPAHNPPYAEGLRVFRERLPGVPRVALFETAFYQWVPDHARRYAVPDAWHRAGIRRYGFHGASHKFVAERSAELLGHTDVADGVRNLYVIGPRTVAGLGCPELVERGESGPGSPAFAKATAGRPPPTTKTTLRVISCHLGGSSSVTGIANGVAIGTSMGLSPQSGLPQNNRVGDLDSAAVPCAMRRLGLTLEQAEKQLTKESGLLGLSGVSNDLRDIKAAADRSDTRARLAIDTYVHSIRHWIGAFWVQLGGCDALVFTAGIGENNPWLRQAVCAGLDDLGLVLDPETNATGAAETDLSGADSRTHVFVIPANEELVVARETARLLAIQRVPTR